MLVIECTENARHAGKHILLKPHLRHNPQLIILNSGQQCLDDDYSSYFIEITDR